jgi:hypothetical protein
MLKLPAFFRVHQLKRKYHAAELSSRVVLNFVGPATHCLCARKVFKCNWGQWQLLENCMASVKYLLALSSSRQIAPSKLARGHDLEKSVFYITERSHLKQLGDEASAAVQELGPAILLLKSGRPDTGSTERAGALAIEPFHHALLAKHVRARQLHGNVHGLVADRAVRGSGLDQVFWSDVRAELKPQRHERANKSEDSPPLSPENQPLQST